jgi:hypothetical protein
MFQFKPLLLPFALALKLCFKVKTKAKVRAKVETNRAKVVMMFQFKLKHGGLLL